MPSESRWRKAQFTKHAVCAHSAEQRSDRVSPSSSTSLVLHSVWSATDTDTGDRPGSSLQCDSTCKEESAGKVGDGRSFAFGTLREVTGVGSESCRGVCLLARGLYRVLRCVVAAHHGDDISRTVDDGDCDEAETVGAAFRQRCTGSRHCCIGAESILSDNRRISGRGRLLRGRNRRRARQVLHGCVGARACGARKDRDNRNGDSKRPGQSCVNAVVHDGHTFSRVVRNRPLQRRVPARVRTSGARVANSAPYGYPDVIRMVDTRARAHSVTFEG